MRKIILCFFILCLLVIALIGLGWWKKREIIASILSKHLNVPVRIEKLELSQTQALATQFWMGNPPISKTNTSFSAKSIEIDSSLRKVMATPLFIDEITMSEIFVGIEYYSGQNNATNWSVILASDPKSQKKARPFVIEKLILNNLTVEVTQANGQTKRYPTIPRLEFDHISSESGLPLAQIEKAIFNLVIQDLFRKLNLDQLLKNIPNSPLKYIPNLFGETPHVHDASLPVPNNTELK